MTAKEIVQYHKKNGYQNSLGSVMPPQKVQMSEKTEDWRRQTVNAIIARSLYNTNQTTKNTWYRKQVNYNLMNSIYDESDMEYVTNPYDVGDNYTLPAKLQDFNIIRPKVERLKGEALKRPFNYVITASAGESISVRSEHKAKMLKDSFEQYMTIQMKKYGFPTEPKQDEQGNVVQPQIPDEINHYINYTYKDTREKYADDIIKYHYLKCGLEEKFARGWEHALIAAEEIYYTGINSGEIIVRVVNPLYFDCSKTPDLENIEDAQWAREDRFMSIGQVLDEFRTYLKDDEIDMLEMNMVSPTFATNGPFPGQAYPLTDLENSNYWYAYNGQNQIENIRVVTVCWKSMREIGKLTYVDEFGDTQVEIITDTSFKLTPEQKESGYKIDWQWINEVWQGTKIGPNIYINIEPLPNQIKSLNNPSVCKLPYVGKIYNNLNSKATSIVDLLKPHQYTYTIVWFRLLMEMAKSKGKATIVDLAQMPKTEGFDTEKLMYYLDNMGIMFINSKQEGSGGYQGEQNKFNQFTTIDRSMSPIVNQYIMVLDYLESAAGELVGVSKQRTGDIAASENVGNVNQSITQSSMVTEYYFFKHDSVRRAVLSRIVELAKLCFPNGIQTQFILDDGYRAFIDSDENLLMDSEFDVHISNSSKDYEIKSKLESLAQAGLQNDKLRFSDIIKIMKSNSIGVIERTILNGEEDQIKRQQDQQEADRNGQKEIENIISMREREKREFEAEQRQLDRENKLETATINTLRGKDGPSDANNNGIIDSIEQNKLFLEQSKIAYDHTLKTKELEAKHKDIETKAKTEVYKANIALQIAKENKNAAELKKKAVNKPKKKK